MRACCIYAFGITSRNLARHGKVAHPPKLPARMTCASRQGLASRVLARRQALLNACSMKAWVHSSGAVHLSGGQRGPEDWHMPVAVKHQPPAVVALGLCVSGQVACKDNILVCIWLHSTAHSPG